MGHHDDYVYTYLYNERNAKEFFLRFLPSDLLALLRVSTLERDSSRLPNKGNGNNHTDMLFSFLHKNLEQKIFTLLKHKSHIRREVFQQVRKQLNSAEDGLPEHLIIPVIFYHGVDKLSLRETLQENKKKVPLDTQPFAALHGLNFKPIIINARSMPPLPLSASVSIRSFIQALIRYNEEEHPNAVYASFYYLIMHPNKNMSCKILSYF